jgi:hypothetical protein
MPRNSRALLSVEIRTAADRGPPQPLLSWAFCRSEFTAWPGTKLVAQPPSFVSPGTELDEPEPLWTLRIFQPRRPPDPEESSGGLPAPKSQLPGTRFRRT